ncbi:hypothetical protein IE989_17095 [Klebsiella pneumoniae]|nr:hypothetical protein [Klebsiella pneumoniae]
MSPEDFIRKHITAALMAEGFSESAAGGGLSTASIITGEAHRQAGKVRFSMIVFFRARQWSIAQTTCAERKATKKKAGSGKGGPTRPVLTAAMQNDSNLPGGVNS